MIRLRFRIALALLLLSATHTAAGESDRLAAKIGAIQDAIRQRNARWIAGETPLSDLTPEEMAGYLGALDPPATPKATRPGINALVRPLSLPAAFDWRNKAGGNYVTAVRNQAGCGSCWAFASTAALEAKVLITLDRPGESFDLSEQTMVSCSGAGSCGGGYLTRAADYLQSTGLPPESCYPYDASNGACAEACPNWPQSAYKMLSSTSVPQTVADLKNAVVNYGPIPVGMRVYSDFQSYRGGIYSYVSGGYLGGHTVLIVGYDNAAGCFIAKNSWSDGWGEAGFFRIAYQEVTGATSFGATALAYGKALPPFPPTVLGEAVDNTSLTWKTGLAAGWFKQSAVSTYGSDAAQSGAIYEYEPSWIETSVAGPADLTFDERISDNADGYLTLYLDGEDIHTLSYRDRGWQHLVKPLGPGTHQLKWALRPYFGGDTAWLDHVIVGPASEQISRPTPPSGPVTGVRVGGLQRYETGGSATTLGHSVEYRFDWGDGTRSPWSSRSSADHAWHVAGPYTVKAQARCATHTSLRTAWSEPFAVAVDPPLPITFGEAVDAPALTFQTGGDAAWFAQDGTAFSGGDAAQSGHITGLYGDGESWISTTVTGPGALQFFWRISSSFYSDLRVSVDGDIYSYEAEISGRYSDGWQQQLVDFGPGAHTITWWYLQDSPDVGGLNAAWIDKIEFLPTYEIIPVPGVPTGTTGATVGISYSYRVGEVASNQVHPLEYRFDWGDGAYSDWSGSPSASHTWSAPKNCGVLVQARCAAHPELVTAWSAALSVRVGALVSIATPTVPTAGAAAWAGIYATYTTEEGDTTHPGNRQYRFDWGDGTTSAWAWPTSANKLETAHRWPSAGTYTVKAQARSSLQTDLESAWSEGLPVIVAALPAVSLAAALDNASLVWTTGGDAGWFGQGLDSVVGGTAAQSGPIADGQSSWFETMVTGPASVSFYWRIAAYSDSLSFTIDGSTGWNYDNVISWERPWAFRVVTIGSGQHTLRWEFRKGTYGFRAPDCARVDKVAIVYSSETVTRAGSLGGSAGGVSGSVLPFTVSGATSSQQHAVEYRFDWNDGTFSDWFATGGASHAWSVPGHYYIRAQTRCAAHPDVVSEWSYQHEVSVSTAPPAAPEGPPAGVDATSYTYTTAGVAPDPGVPLKYIFDWGDGHVSTRSSSLDAAHSWSAPGTYQVRVQTVLASGGYSCESPWSAPLAVTIQWYETISVPTLDGPPSGIVRTPCDYTASGAVSSLGHALVYSFQWDSRNSDTGTQATREKSWTSAGAHTAKVTARCATHAAYQAESATVTTTVSLPQETVTTPDPPVGPASVTTGQVVRYDFTGSTTSLGHAVTYDIDMGDGRIYTLNQQGHYVAWPKAGTYAMRARAHCSLDYANQSGWSLPLTVRVADPPETITAPAAPIGQRDGLLVGDSAVYTSGGSVSSLGHEVEYRFAFGSGPEYTEWSSVPLTVRTWKNTYTGSVKAQARCVADPSMFSSWSPVLAVYVSQESIARLGAPSGPGSGIADATYEFVATDADPALGHGREFSFDWGDGTTSAWQSGEARNHAWAAPGTYPVRVKGRCAVHTAVEASSWSYPLNVVIRPPNALAAAVDAPALSWETGGDAAWFNQGANFHFDGDAARSGAVGNSQSAWMQTTVPGPGELSFFWRVSSGAGDALILFLDGVELTRISGEVPWESRTVPLGTGTHTLLWLYRKDEAGVAGADCGWVDQVALTTEVDMISTPAPPVGPAGGITAEAYSYEAAGALSSKGHALEYRFDWGDGTTSAWSSTASAEHTWSAAGTYPVVVQARCQAEPAAVSAFSEQLHVAVDLWVENVGAPEAPSGTSNLDVWNTVSFSTSGAVSDLGHYVQYRFRWGDDTTSPWSGESAADHFWSGPGVFEVQAQARCGRHTSMESAWSDVFLVAVVLPPERIGTPRAPAGPAGGKTNALLRFSTGGSTSNLRHPVEYRFDWGDGTSSDWGAASRKHDWSTAGTYTIAAQARCATDSGIEPAWSALAEVTISDHYDLGLSVDNDALVWETGGDVPWFAERTTYAWDRDAAQAGVLRTSGSSWISTLVEGPTTVYFLWRTRSDVRKDKLLCSLDGIEKASITGATPWLFDAVGVDAGVHEMKWEFSRGLSRTTATHLGWLDLVVTDPREIAGSLAVLTPPDHQVWPRRTSVALQWEREGIIGPAVRLQLLARGSGGNWVVISTLADALPDTGSYVWRVPTTLQPGRHYKIRVHSSADVSISADSPGSFTVR